MLVCQRNHTLHKREAVMDIVDAGLPSRARTFCKNWAYFAGQEIKTLEQLAELSRIDILLMPNCGRKTLAAMEKVLQDNGLEFRPWGKADGPRNYRL